MRLRPYMSSKDFEYLESWVGKDERIHALWCANIIPFPLSQGGLNSVLDKAAKDWEDCAYTVTDEKGKPLSTP